MMVRAPALKVWDDVDTDLIIPGKYLVLTDPRELARHVFENVYPEFREKASRGVVLVAGKNFGCGSSREHAPIALKHSGVLAVVAESFARIFYRNAINIGLPAVECRGVSRVVEDGDTVLLDVEAGVFRNLSRSITLMFKPLPPVLRDILRSGGLVPYLRRRLGVG